MKTVRVLPVQSEERDRGKITVAAEEVRIYLPANWTESYRLTLIALAHKLAHVKWDRTFRAKSILKYQTKLHFKNSTNTMHKMIDVDGVVRSEWTDESFNKE